MRHITELAAKAMRAKLVNMKDFNTDEIIILKSLAKFLGY